MKQGIGIKELAARLLKQTEEKKDFLVDTRSMKIGPLSNGQSGLKFDKGQSQDLLITPYAHRQIADRLGIPAKYYDRMLQENTELLHHNVNAWLSAKPERRLVRTLGNTARAYLSDRYRRIDNVDLMESVLPIIDELPGAEIISCELTETRLYLKVVNRRLEMDVRPGDTVQSGFVLSNSEVGAGSVRVEPLIYRLVCSNGLVVPEYGKKRYHVGRALDMEENREIFRDETMAADDHAFLLKTQDIIRLSVDRAKFAHIANRLREAANEPLTGNPVRSVEILANRFMLNQDESGSILRNLINGGDLTRYGLINAITRSSQDAEVDYERATEMERLGGQMITLDSKDWHELATAA